MSQINCPAEPLKLQKKLQGGHDNSDVEISQDQNPGKRKSVDEKIERCFKQAKLDSMKEEPETSNNCIKEKSQAFNKHNNKEPDAINFLVKEEPQTLVNVSQDPASIQPSTTSVLSVPQPQSELSSDVEDNNDDNDDSCELQSTESSSELKQYSKIVYCVGIDLIQNLVHEIKLFLAQSMSPLDSIFKAAEKLKIKHLIKFKYFNVPNHPPKSSGYNCRFLLKHKAITFLEKADCKIEAMEKCAASAVDILIKISNSYSFCSEDSSNVSGSQGNSSKISDSNEDMAMLQKLGENMPSGENIPISLLFHAVRKLNIEKYILFRETGGSKQAGCNFFYKNILLSSACGKKKKAKRDALNAALVKLRNLSNYEVQNGELKEKIKKIL